MLAHPFRPTTRPRSALVHLRPPVSYAYLILHLKTHAIYVARFDRNNSQRHCSLGRIECLIPRNRKRLRRSFKPLSVRFAVRRRISFARDNYYYNRRQDARDRLGVDGVANEQPAFDCFAATRGRHISIIPLRNRYRANDPCVWQNRT